MLHGDVSSRMMYVRMGRVSLGFSMRKPSGSVDLGSRVVLPMVLGWRMRTELVCREGSLIFLTVDPEYFYLD